MQPRSPGPLLVLLLILLVPVCTAYVVSPAALALGRSPSLRRKNSAHPRLSPSSLAGSASNNVPYTRRVADPYSGFAEINLPRHGSNERIDRLLQNSEDTIKAMQGIFAAKAVTNMKQHLETGPSIASEFEVAASLRNTLILDDDPSFDTYRMEGDDDAAAEPSLDRIGRVYANSYVDLEKIKVVGFDFDYTLVQYTDELLNVIYNMARDLLVSKYSMPTGLRETLKFDPTFAIRGLAVDKKTGWICHLSYTHKVSQALEGRKKVSRDRLLQEYSGRSELTREEREKRLKPLNDLFSMAECCLIADVVEYFKSNNLSFHPPTIVNVVMDSIRDTHISGNFHKLVAAEPQKFFRQTPFMARALAELKEGNKTLLLVSNSPFWYVNAGMVHNIGPDWRDLFQCIIVNSGKPTFYTEKNRPFREVEVSRCAWGKEELCFHEVEKILPGKVYREGCLAELIRLMPSLSDPIPTENDLEVQLDTGGGGLIKNSNVLYVGDSLFADLVDAKREYGWITAGVLSELGDEIKNQDKVETRLIRKTIECLLHTLRWIQLDMDKVNRTPRDFEILKQLELLVSQARDKQNRHTGNGQWGSIFSARHQNSFFSDRVRRYCDLYMESVASLLHYSPQHRFYPHEIINSPHHNEIASIGEVFSSEQVKRFILFGVDPEFGIENEEYYEDDGTELAEEGDTAS